MAIFSQIETGRGTRGNIVAGSWFQCQPVFVYSGYFDHSYFLPTPPRQWNWSTIINSSTWETCCTTCELTLLICPSGDGTELSLPRFPGVLGPNFDLKQTCLARAVSVSPIVCVFLPTVKSWRNTHVYCFHPLANRNQRKKKRQTAFWHACCQFMKIDAINIKVHAADTVKLLNRSAARTSAQHVKRGEKCLCPVSFSGPCFLLLRLEHLLIHIIVPNICNNLLTTASTSARKILDRICLVWIFHL